MKNNFRQKLHLEAESGWINDPNGLCYFNGEYHVYFQYSPDSPIGEGRKCWGHWKSPDLIKWRYAGIVLYPDTPEDKDGVYSGCGFVKGDTLYLFYTGNVKEEGDHDYVTSGRGANVILVTTKNGQDMSPKKVLLRNCDYPADCSCHVRDPNVWEEHGKYYMVLGARTLQDKGCVLKYGSDDLEHWVYIGRYSAEDMGYMWECPDEFTIGKNRFLGLSPQGLVHSKYIHQNVYSSGYFSLANGRTENFREWDKGFDIYAPQTFEAPDGRRIFIGWEGIGDIPYSNPTVGCGWQHCLTLPRELTVDDNGDILQNPVRELETLRRKEKEINSGDSIQTILPFELKGCTDKEFKVTLEGILTLEYKNGEVMLSFISENAGCGRYVRYAQLESCRDIRLIADTSSAEVYLNGGKIVFSTRMYPEDTDISLWVEGVSGSVYELEGIEVINDE